MLSKNQINTMLSLQNGMNCKVNPDWANAGYAYLRAAMIESVEGIEHHGWKWWKAQHKDLAQLQMEMIDIWHFALSDYILKTQGDLELAQVSISKALETPDSLIFDGQTYNFSTMELLDNLQLMTGLCAAKRFNVNLFMTVAKQCELSGDDLYEQYVGKNVLNFFRQDHGYKNGTYIKEWKGLEDNEHLVQVLATLDKDAADYSDQIYAGLKARYPSAQ